MTLQLTDWGRWRRGAGSALAAAAAVAVGMAFGFTDPAAAGAPAPANEDIALPDNCEPFSLDLLSGTITVDGDTITYHATWTGQLPPCEFVTVFAALTDTEADELLLPMPGLPAEMFENPGVTYELSRDLPCQYEAVLFVEVDGSESTLDETSGDRCAPEDEPADGQGAGAGGLPSTGAASGVAAGLAVAFLAAGVGMVGLSRRRVRAEVRS